MISSKGAFVLEYERLGEWQMRIEKEARGSRRWLKNPREQVGDLN